MKASKTTQKGRKSPRRSEGDNANKRWIKETRQYWKREDWGGAMVEYRSWWNARMHTYFSLTNKGACLQLKAAARSRVNCPSNGNAPALKAPTHPRWQPYGMPGASRNLC